MHSYIYFIPVVITASKCLICLTLKISVLNYLVGGSVVEWLGCRT